MTTKIKLSKKDMEKILKEKFPKATKIEWNLKSKWVGVAERDAYEIKSFDHCIVKEEK